MRIETIELAKSAFKPKDLLSDPFPEIVFAGRSNVGKSSLINKLLKRKNIARISSTPGKTINVNYFKINSRYYFVDLPGYGFAKAAASERRRWYELVESYFRNSQTIAVVVHLIDARRGIMDIDRELVGWLTDLGHPFILVLTKSDKLKRGPMQKVLNEVDKELGDDIPVVPVSSKSGQGISILWSQLKKYLP